MTIKKYIHIGYPKNFSTSLQTGYFAKHQDLYHLGIGYESANTGYIDKHIEIAMEQHLRFSKHFIYERVESDIANTFKKHFEAAASVGKKYVGVSSEHLSFNLTPDNIDISEKVKRIRRIFDRDTKIIIIVRNQLSLFRSMYREAVRNGYHQSYASYVEYLYKFQARNFVPDFLYDRLYQLCYEYFQKENILLIPMETVREGNNGTLRRNSEGTQILTQKISDFLEIEPFKEDLKHVNESLDGATTAALAQLNNDNRYGLSNCLYDGEQMHRLRSYFESELKCFPPKSDADWQIKWANIDKAKLSKSEFPEKLDYSCDSDLLNRLKAFYAPSNKKLQELLNIDLSEYGYPV